MISTIIYLIFSLRHLLLLPNKATGNNGAITWKGSIGAKDMWRVMNNNLIKLGVGRAWRGSSSSIAPNKKRHTFHLQQEIFFYSTTPAGRRIFSDTQPMKDLQPVKTFQPMKSHYTWTSSFLQWTLYLQWLLWPSLSSVGEQLLFFVLWTCLWFTIRLHVLNCILCCGQINPFCWRNVWLFV